MTVFKHMPMGEEGLQEVFAWIDDFVKKNEKIVEKKIIGRSEDDKWEIPAIILTNKSIPKDDKQISIVTLARHGNERGAIVVGPEILNFMASPEASEIRDKQTVVVVPVCNPVGVVLDKFHSTMSGITDLEKEIMGNLCADYPPDMMIDYHSLGKVQGAKYDRGDMEVIIPANTTKWGMDEQIYQHIAGKMVEATEAKGFPYEIHSLEDLACYYFGEMGNPRLPWKYQKEKVFLLNVQNSYEHYDTPEKLPGYTNYTCGPAYMKWHTLVFGMETNHWSLKADNGLAESGMFPCQALLDMGNQRFSWEKDLGYPTNLICGDFRISIRAFGNSPGERRISREKLWCERNNFSLFDRALIDPETTLAKVGYMGDQFPLEFALCLRMREKVIKTVLIEDQETAFDTFEDQCSTFLHIPMSMKKEGVLNLKIIHEPFKKDDRQ